MKQAVEKMASCQNGKQMKCLGDNNFKQLKLKEDKWQVDEAAS